MIVCLACGHRHGGEEFRCPHCHAQPVWIDGFAAFAPELQDAVDGFDPAAHALLAQHEDAHFWFAARNRLILSAIRTHFPHAHDYMEIGCGTGYVLRAVADAFPDMRILGSEVLSAGLHHAASRVPRARLVQMDARQLPFDQEFDLIGAYDVIEHIDEDEAVIGEVHRALKPGGGVVLTVPQHSWLWSRQDDLARHQRRYDRGELETKLRRNGFDILYSSSFMSLLLPMVWWSRRRTLAARQVENSEMSPGRLTNTLLAGVLAVERALLRTGLRLPWGTSRLVVARRTP